MSDAAGSGQYQCPDCGQTYHKETSLNGHQAHCDGLARGPSDDEVIIGATTGSNADGTRVYHTMRDCVSVSQIDNPRICDRTALTDDWRHCRSCQTDAGVYHRADEQPGGDQSTYLAVRDASPEEVGD